jgi:hypothetical protein
MPRDHGLGAVVLKIAYCCGALIFAAFFAHGMAGRRGWALGVLAFLTYGSIFGALALSRAGVQRWSARHVALDSSLVVPLSFFALLMIPALSWWAAALISLGLGAVFVPFVVHRRAAVSAARAPER